jgi:hypothetical protein
LPMNDTGLPGDTVPCSSTVQFRTGVSDSAAMRRSLAPEHAGNLDEHVGVENRGSNQHGAPWTLDVGLAALAQSWATFHPPGGPCARRRAPTAGDEPPALRKRGSIQATSAVTPDGVDPSAHRVVGWLTCARRRRRGRVAPPRPPASAGTRRA